MQLIEPGTSRMTRIPIIVSPEFPMSVYDIRRVYDTVMRYDYTHYVSREFTKNVLCVPVCFLITDDWQTFDDCKLFGKGHFEKSPTTTGMCNVQFSHGGIWIRPGLSYGECLETLIHELSHLICGSFWRSTLDNNTEKAPGITDNEGHGIVFQMVFAKAYKVVTGY
jgi:hypothetical protein